MGRGFELDDAVFTYVISTKADLRFSQHTGVGEGLIISHTSKTQVVTAKQSRSDIAIIGYCIDSHGEIPRLEIPGRFLSYEWNDISEAYHFFDRFAGKYAVFFQSDGLSYIWGDASASLGICYSFPQSGFCAASADKLLADFCGFKISEYSKVIREASSAYSQPLPKDLTMYAEIKSLLPNHYLDCSACRPVRLKLGTQETSSPQEITEIIDRTTTLVNTIVETYQQDYSFACPLTAGTDSRVIFSFFKENNPNLECFTFNHISFAPQSAETAVSQQICGDFRHSHKLIDDIDAPKCLFETVRKFFGEYADTSSVNNAYMFLKSFAGKAQADGSIIDEVGKSTQENAVPNRFLNIPFFMCKLHNYSSSTKQELKNYLQGIADAGDQEHTADLFAMEQKLGRRVGQVASLYSICGINFLNIFNCREVILQWTRIPRKLRIKKYIPRELLRKKDSRLLEYPFNPEDKITALLKKHWLPFYLATFAKYYVSHFFSR